MTEEAKSLVDLPSAWMQQLVRELVRELGAESAMALCRTCIFLRDQVLGLPGSRVLFTARLPIIPQADTGVVTRSLLLAATHANSVKLTLRGQGEQSLVEVAAAQLLADVTAAAGGPLNAITSVRLEGLALHALLPAWLGPSTCPALHTLHITGCTLTHPPDLKEAGDVTATPQLRRLKYTGAGPTTQESVAWWQRHLKALPSLTSAVFTDILRLQHVMTSCAAAAPQLTGLHVRRKARASEGTFPLPQAVAAFHNLAELHFANVTFDDTDMDVLLELEHLKELHCMAFYPQRHNMAHRQCKWQEVVFVWMSLEAFMNLPLEGVRRFVVNASEVTRVKVNSFCVTSARVADIKRLVSLVERRGGLHWTAASPFPCIHTHDALDVSSPAVTAFLPIFSTLDKGVFGLGGGVGITLELLSALRAHLSPRLPAMAFQEGCVWSSPEVFPVLLPALPPSLGRVLLPCARLSEEQLIQVCAHACRPILIRAMHAGRHYAEGWRERVQEAMAAAGHQHVTFCEDATHDK